MGIVVLFVISLIVSTIIVNAAQQLFMKVLGINVMFFRAKTKIIIIIILAFVIAAIIMQIFGIEVPK